MGRDGCEVRLGVTPVSDGVHRRVMSRVCPGSPRCLFTGTGKISGKIFTGTVCTRVPVPGLQLLSRPRFRPSVAWSCQLGRAGEGCVVGFGWL